MIEVYNYPKTLKIPKRKFTQIIQSSIKKSFRLEGINIIFINPLQIQKLNMEYREVDAPTDVLSFNYNTPDLLGEVYICLEYIEKNTKGISILEEVFRLAVHGILHLYGYDHIHEFVDVNQENLENMFVIQEKIVNDILKKI